MKRLILLIYLLFLNQYEGLPLNQNQERELEDILSQFYGNFDKFDKEKFERPVESYSFQESSDSESNNIDLFQDTKFKVDVGQVGGVALDGQQNLVIFQRNGRKWGNETFYSNNTYVKITDGPIRNATILRVTKDGEIIKTLGANQYYMPHGMTVDKVGNYWITDVAMHQIFRINSGQSHPSLTLGEKFKPAMSNRDLQRFCKPTDIAVTSSGEFFVADGYCNSRILKYNKEGELIDIFGLGDFEIPHSLALFEEFDVICVADREGERILCYNAGISNPKLLGQREAKLDYDIGRVYAIEFDSNGLLYAVRGPSESLPSMGMTIEFERDADRWNYDIIAKWQPKKGFYIPHDVTVSPNGENVYVGEIRFTITSGNIHKFTHGTVVHDSIRVNDNGKVVEKQNENIIKKSFM